MTINLFQDNDQVSKASKNDLTVFTTRLIGASDALATELLKTARNDEAFAQELTSSILEVGKLFALIESTLEIKTDSIDEATESQLDRLLESRRSERSTSKTKGLDRSQNVLSYLSATIAEMIIRKASGKPYNSKGASLDEQSADAIERRIASLRSKASRIRQLVQLSPAKQPELDEIVAEIARLQVLLGKQPKAPKLSNAEAIKSLEAIDLNAVAPDMKARIEEALLVLRAR